ncbi:MAG: hypothetical protein R3A13_08785 [Bdellovibrionota bacterium]
MKKYLLTILCLMFLSSCSLMDSGPRPKANPFKSELPETEAEARAIRRKQEKRKPGSSVYVEKLQTPESTKPNAVVILWKVPTAAVDGYLLNYGFSGDTLEKQKTFKTSELETLDDPKAGLVFKIVLEEIPADKTLYYTVTAFTGEIFSDPSEVKTLKPDSEDEEN